MPTQDAARFEGVPTPPGALNRPIVFGTRGSALAMAQTTIAIERLRKLVPNQTTEVRVVRTEGDIDRVSPLTEIGGRGVFTNALERGILDGSIDAAVHSAKDLPTNLHPDVPIVAFPDRGDPRDVLVTRHLTTLDGLPANPVIGTSSRRREAQILHLRPDARIKQIRGNIDTRLQKALTQEFDGVVLAAAGIQRMGWGDRVSEFFDVERFVPSPGQGAIAIQAGSDSPVAGLLAVTDDPLVSLPVHIERAFLAAIGAGCTMPIGAYARASGAGYRLKAMVADASGRHIAFADEALAAGAELDHAGEVAKQLLAQVDGNPAARQWRGAVSPEKDLLGATVIVTRPRRQAGQLLKVLADRGAEAIPLPTIQILPALDMAPLDDALRVAVTGGFDWLVFTSANAVAVVGERSAALQLEVGRLAAVQVAAVGEATASAVRMLGLPVALVPEEATGEALAAALGAEVRPGARVLHPRSAIARDTLSQMLRPADVDVVAVAAYETHPEVDVDPLVLERLRHGNVNAMTFSSPSSVHNLLALFGDDRSVVAAVPAICAGPVTAEAAVARGLTIGAVSAAPNATAMADALAQHWATCRCKLESESRPFRGGQILNVESANEGSAS